ncbi:GmrSD restriction endonuclease domain-containing protein [Nostoc sp.]|uniref:GmrSD restriction endonuclease domain-containing protein n=1 Tax=Nostoc sp. TaxID=1180 RepID=UPI002FF62DF8
MSITPKGTSVLELYRLYRTEKLIVNRRYQRKLVWTKSEKTRLIESLLLNYPIPLILLGVFNDSDGEEVYEIIDGMQRLNAIFSFIENEFSVQEKYFDITKHPFAYELSQAKLFKPADVKKSVFFDSDICAKLLEYSVAVTIYRANLIDEIEDIFNRINSNGKHLSPQEVRQAGVTTKFSTLVRFLAAEIRGDVSREELPLTEMPEISIDAKSIALGYGVYAEDTFWCNQGILRISGLRDSEDEQLLADIILSIALGEPFAAGKDNFDAYYGKGDKNKSDKIELAIAKYGEDNLQQDIKTVLSHIKNAINAVNISKQNNFLRNILSRQSGGSNPVKEPFYTLFMSFYELIIKESKEPFEYEKVFAAVQNLITKIKMSPNVKMENRIDNIGLTKGLIQNYFKHSNSPTRSSGSYAIDFENYLRRSKTEAPNYDFKQGLYTLEDKNRKFYEQNLEKIIQNIAAIANLGKGKKGYIFIGVTDKEQDTQRIEKLDNITAPRFFTFGIVGLEREARLKNISLDDYILSISRKIRDSKLPEWLKTAVNTCLTPLTYMEHTVLMIEIKAGNEPVWYGDKLYIRDGHEKKPQEVSGGQTAAVYNLFR